CACSSTLLKNGNAAENMKTRSAPIAQSSKINFRSYSIANRSGAFIEVSPRLPQASRIRLSRARHLSLAEIASQAAGEKANPSQLQSQNAPQGPVPARELPPDKPDVENQKSCRRQRMLHCIRTATDKQKKEWSTRRSPGLGADNS